MTDETIPIIREIAQFLAELVSNHVFLYERVHYVNGRRFLVKIAEYKTADDTHPIKAAE
jgi:hypothetical protein